MSVHGLRWVNLLGLVSRSGVIPWGVYRKLMVRIYAEHLSKLNPRIEFIPGMRKLH